MKGSASIPSSGAWANIPPKRNHKEPICFSPYLYRARNLVERIDTFGAGPYVARFYGERIPVLRLTSCGRWLAAEAMLGSPRRVYQSFIHADPEHPEQPGAQASEDPDEQA